MKLKRFAVMAAALFLSAGSLLAQEPVAGKATREDGLFRQGLALYEKGMFSEARTVFESLGKGSRQEGYVVLCALRAKAEDRDALLWDYAQTYPYSGLAPRIHYYNALNLFDEEKYAEAGEEFSMFPVTDLDKADRAEYYFKEAYCSFATGDYDGALYGFGKVEALPMNNFTAPARYATGYIWYERENFKEALDWFGQSVKDPRFEDISNYYIMECHFMEKDYKYVTANAEDVFAKVPEERRQHLARLISESYLVLGDAETAKKYYTVIRDNPDKERGDWFYAGSLLYQTGDYQGAVDNYSMMTERTDSIGQVANYQMAYADIQLKNKVAALEAFRDASMVSWDPAMQEDAFFNYAKLAFDLNNDSSIFDKYIDKYSDTAKGEQIYSYQALAALGNRDYASAIAAYDKIEELDEDMQRNYMKANYLRANQLIQNGTWRDAVPCLKAAAYYSGKYEGFNQLSRYWLAEASYRDEQYKDARNMYTELYNISALDGRSEGKLLPYNIAYCYFQEGEYEQAARWFGQYASDTRASAREDALVRKADCDFIRRDYKAAAEAYAAVATEYKNSEDAYAPYRSGLAYGLAENSARKIEVLSMVQDLPATAKFWPDAMYELGRTYLNTKKDAEAMACYKEIVSKSKDDSFVARALIDLGMVSRNASRYDEALGYYKQVVEKMPTSGYKDDALLAIESIYQAKQAPEEYLAYVEGLDESVRGNIDSENVLFTSAEQMYVAGNYDKALVVLQNYVQRYPQGRHMDDAEFYMAECLRNTGRKDQACDWYQKVIERGSGSFLEISALQYARLSYGMERYAQAYEGFKRLSEIAKMDANKHLANIGMMESAYGAKDNGTSVTCADLVLQDAASTADEKRLAQYIKAKSYLASSNRKGAMDILSDLAGETDTAEGAEAAFMLIQDSYDRGDFEDVQKRVFAFSDSGSSQTYWMAKSFLLLGDTYVEKEDYRQARATFESVRDGYTPFGDEDDVPEEVALRLERLGEMGK